MLRARKYFCMQTARYQAARLQCAHFPIVIDDKYGTLRGGIHARAAAWYGSVNRNVAPGPEFGVAQIRPPCDSTIERLIAKPMPVPCGFVVKNASKI